MPVPAEGPAKGDPAAVCQASLNEIAAALFKIAPGDPKQVRAALAALRELNWAAGLDFVGAPPSPAGAPASTTWGWRSSISADWRPGGPGTGSAPHWKHSGSDEPCPKRRWSQCGGQGPAPPPSCTWSCTLPSAPPRSASAIQPGHGYPSTGGQAGSSSRLFRVAVSAALAIEADVLRWWRADLALPPFLSQEQIPQADGRRLWLRAASTWPRQWPISASWLSCPNRSPRSDQQATRGGAWVPACARGLASCDHQP